MTGRPSRIDPVQLRRALGVFATGVALVTTRDAAGTAVAMTINSFSPVSLEPPLVLWSLRRQSGRHAIFTAASDWVVNVLHRAQRPLARRFAARDGGCAAGLPLRPGTGAVPVLEGALASFECRRQHVMELGDHSVLVGEVIALHHCGGEPLVFHEGRFGGAPAQLAPG